MAVSLFFTAFMAMIVWFFGLSGDVSSPARWLYSAAMLAVFFAMVRTREYSRWRRAFIVSFASYNFV